MHERLVAGMADAESHAPVVVAHMRGDRAQAIVSGVAAAELYPQLARREIEFVMQHEYVGERDLVETRRLGDGAAALIHEGFGF